MFNTVEMLPWVQLLLLQVGVAVHLAGTKAAQFQHPPPTERTSGHCHFIHLTS